jgi:hypothetical protein
MRRLRQDSAGCCILDDQHYARFRTADGTVNYTCQTGNLPVMATAAFQVTVRDAPIHDTGRAVSATAGQSFSAVVAHVTDDNPGGVAADLSASVAWGDGTTSEAAVAAALGGGFDVTGVHAYATPGTFTVSTTVTSAGASSGGATSMATVAVAPLALPTDDSGSVSGEAHVLPDAAVHRPDG